MTNNEQIKFFAYMKVFFINSSKINKIEKKPNEDTINQFTFFEDQRFQGSKLKTAGRSLAKSNIRVTASE